MKNQPEEERWQSSVIGVVLVFGLVIASTTLVATLGGVALLDAEGEYA